MIRRLLARLIPGRPARQPRIYSAGDHPVRREQVPRSARTVIDKLHEAGFRAFVVGGAVRDLMLGLTPKDFDMTQVMNRIVDEIRRANQLDPA